MDEKGMLAQSVGPVSDSMVKVSPRPKLGSSSGPGDIAPFKEVPRETVSTRPPSLVPLEGYSLKLLSGIWVLVPYKMNAIRVKDEATKGMDDSEMRPVEIASP